MGGYGKEGRDDASVHIYTFNLEKERLMSEEVIDSLNSAPEENGYNDISLLINETSDKDELFIIESQFAYVEPSEDQAFFGETVTVKKVIKYNLQTEETEDISLPEDGDLGIPFAYSDGELHFANIVSNQLNLSNYDIDEKEVTEHLQIETVYSQALSDIFQTLVRNGKLYFVPSPQDISELTTITVVDLDTLDINYHGKVEYVSPPESNAEANIHFNYPEWRE